MSNQKLTTEKWDELKEMYGDNAYLMVSVRCLDGGSWNTCVSNQHLIAVMDECENMEYVIKDSAGLPFDLERAKAGDAVEVYSEPHLDWITVERIKKSYDYYVVKTRAGKKCVGEHFLRMKYPPKANNKSTTTGEPQC
jgi:hypothetical protein